jgi:hypothetical protein
MRITSLVVLILGSMLMPAFCQERTDQPPARTDAPLLYAETTVYNSDLNLLKSDDVGGGSPAAATVTPVVPAPAVTRNFVQPMPQEIKPKSTQWKLSLLALTAAHAADAATSWNKRELNPLLSPSNGAFGGQALAIKSVIAGATMGLQVILMRHHPQLAKMFTIVNYAQAGVIGVTAFHNSTVSSRR